MNIFNKALKVDERPFFYPKSSIIRNLVRLFIVDTMNNLTGLPDFCEQDNLKC